MVYPQQQSKPAVQKPAVQKPAVQKPAVQEPAVQEPSVQKQQKKHSSKDNFSPGRKSKDWIGAIMLHKLKGVFWLVKITRMEAGR